jgi:hypothetical protein
MISRRETRDSPSEGLGCPGERERDTLAASLDRRNLGRQSKVRTGRGSARPGANAMIGASCRQCQGKNAEFVYSEIQIVATA